MGPDGFHFRVRNGNGWSTIGIATLPHPTRVQYLYHFIMGKIVESPISEICVDKNRTINCAEFGLIRSARLKTSRPVHLRPINLVVF